MLPPIVIATTAHIEHFTHPFNGKFAGMFLYEVDLPETDRLLLKHLLGGNEPISQVHRLGLQFKKLMETKQAHELASWCADVENLLILSGFVWAIRQDFAAIEEAFLSEWSNKQTEEQVNRLKTIKRTMYGKANFDLLRLRVLAQNWTGPPK